MSSIPNDPSWRKSEKYYSLMNSMKRNQKFLISTHLKFQTPGPKIMSKMSKEPLEFESDPF